MIRNFKIRKGLNHPNIVKTEALYIDICKKKAYMVMELIEGPDLLEILSKVKRLEGIHNPKLAHSNSNLFRTRSSSNF